MRGLAGIWAPAALGSLVPVPAEAHLATTRFGDFYGGALHVATAPEHVLALLALGLLSGLQQPRDARWMLVAAPFGLLAGALSAVAAPLDVLAPALDMTVLLFLGLLVTFAWRFRATVLAGAGLLVGLLHGYQNGLEIGEGTVMPLFVLGVAASGLIAVALIAAGAVTLQQCTSWGRIALRAGGSWIAAIGVMMLGFAVA